VNARRAGTTLYELLIALCMIGVLLSIALPNLRESLDALNARAAREAAFAVFSRARVVALQQGGANITLDPQRDLIRISTSRARDFEQRFAEADLIVEGTEDTVTLRYDAHGLGRMMSRTVSFRARSKTAGLTISSFGRVRRW